MTGSTRTKTSQGGFPNPSQSAVTNADKKFATTLELRERTSGSIRPMTTPLHSRELGRCGRGSLAFPKSVDVDANSGTIRTHEHAECVHVCVTKENGTLVPPLLLTGKPVVQTDASSTPRESHNPGFVC